MKRTLAFAMLALLPLLAEAQVPSAAVTKGVLLERDSLEGDGEFCIRADSNEVFRYRYDRHTYVVRDSRLINVPALNPGEDVEVISDSVAGSLVRLARDVHVVSEAPSPHPRPLAASRLLIGADPLDRFFPALPEGDLTFAGVVCRVTGERVILHTRGGEQPILLRRDTRYVQDGATVGFASLKPNMRVFIRGGKDLWDQVEAYQVFWGEILQPR